MKQLAVLMAFEKKKIQINTLNKSTLFLARTGHNAAGAIC